MESQTSTSDVARTALTVDIVDLCGKLHRGVIDPLPEPLNPSRQMNHGEGRMVSEAVNDGGRRGSTASIRVAFLRKGELLEMDEFRDDNLVQELVEVDQVRRDAEDPQIDHPHHNRFKCPLVASVHGGQVLKPKRKELRGDSVEQRCCFGAVAGGRPRVFDRFEGTEVGHG